MVGRNEGWDQLLKSRIPQSADVVMYFVECAYESGEWHTVKSFQKGGQRTGRICWH
jgi:hypothetical protein